MSAYSLAEAEHRLSDLIDRALTGESVVITRAGLPLVEIRRLPAPVAAVSLADIDWLARRRVGTKTAKQDSGTLVGAMRDADER